MPAQYVKAYVRRHKNDAADAGSDLRGGGPAEHAVCGDQDGLTTSGMLLHRGRERLVRQREHRASAPVAMEGALRTDSPAEQGDSNRWFPVKNGWPVLTTLIDLKPLFSHEHQAALVEIPEQPDRAGPSRCEAPHCCDARLQEI